MIKSINQPNTKFSLDFLWKLLLSLTLLFYGLSVASNVLIPLVFSLFIALLLNPIVAWLEKKGVASALAILVSLILVSSIVSGGIFYVTVQAKSLISDLPDLIGKLEKLVNNVANQLSELGLFSATEQVDLIKQNFDKILSSSGSFFTEALSATSNFLTFFTLVPIYIFFFLLYRKNFKHFLALLGDRYKDPNLTQMAVEIKKMTFSYISGLLIVVSIIAVLNTAGLLILGIKYAIFMGILSAVLTIIPYIGIFIGASLPIIVALITKDSLFYPLGVAGIYAFVQFVEGNFITPNVVGSKVDVNPLAAIVALIIGGQVWGIIGMILAIPLCGIMRIVFSHYEPLKPYALLLQSSSNAHTEDEAVQNIKKKKLFKRKSKSQAPKEED
ncbi:MAG: AI-2E family transporter [Vicingaceae bacterium]